jgi:chorismate synthase
MKSDPAALEIRELSTQAEYQACVALQYETWGRDFRDAVPASVLHISQRLGGVAAGAFDRDQLVGFVFGITGVEQGTVVHWSDMLAVRANLRSQGVGRQLKEFQRTHCERIGARWIYWTYDPLVARNAHLNFNVFGVRVVEYVPDMYGNNTGSELHRGIGTDRFIVAWPVDDAALAERRHVIAAAREDARFLTAPVQGEPDAPRDTPARGARLRVAAPADLLELQRTSPARAVEWRRSTRLALQQALADGFEVVGFRAGANGDNGHYLLERR